MNPPHAAHQSLSSLVRSATLEGCAAGTVGGLALLFWQPWLVMLLGSQIEFGLSLTLYLFVCAQVGVATALVIALNIAGHSPPR
jgi:hypothetical protein